jgi:hypothetical protein
MIAFHLSMPGVGSWNGRWSGEGNVYVKVVSFGRGAKAQDREAAVVAASPFYYAFGDGWAASIEVEVVDSTEARKLRRKSAGFCGYGWMVDEIIEHGRILTLAERAAA